MIAYIYLDTVIFQAFKIFQFCSLTPFFFNMPVASQSHHRFCIIQSLKPSHYLAALARSNVVSLHAYQINFDGKFR